MSRIVTPKTENTTKNDEQTERPKRYNVILLNDDYTTMDFVVALLEQVFHKERDAAVRIMLQVHRQGMGVAGVYVKEIAEAKCEAVHEIAGAHGFPLHCIVEPLED